MGSVKRGGGQTKADLSSPKKRRPGTAKNKRDRALLFVLLITIGVLLAVLLAVLPDSPRRDPITDAIREEPTAVSPGSAETRLGESDGSADPEGPTESEDRHVADPIVTEFYPEEETPVSAVRDSRDEMWWLPAGVAPDMSRGTLYLVLDDGGNNGDTLERFLAFPGPLSVAVLPLLPYSVETAIRATSAGKDVILHLPMEPVGGANPGPGAIFTGMSDRDIIETLGENLRSVPGVVGVNNHMGSLATQDQRTMEVVLSELRRRELFFLDSRTTVGTVARAVARDIELPFAERHVFLDNLRTREDILTSLHHALELSLSTEAVIMIGHITVGLLSEILSEVYPILSDAGYRFGSITDLLSTASAAQGTE